MKMKCCILLYTWAFRQYIHEKRRVHEDVEGGFVDPWSLYANEVLYFVVNMSIHTKNGMNMEFHSKRISNRISSKFLIRIRIFSNFNIRLEYLNGVEMFCLDAASSAGHGHKSGPEPSVSWPYASFFILFLT